MESDTTSPATVRAGLEIGADFDQAEWTRFVQAEATSTPAHLIEWRKLIHEVFGYQPLYRVAKRDGRICGALPAFLVRSALLGTHIISVSFLNSGGICSTDDEARQALIDDAHSLVRLHRARHLEMRCGYPPPEGLPAREHKVRIVVDLPGTAGELWSSLRSEIRNRIRRAQNAGLKVEFNSSETDGFYEVFAENMRDLGVPAHPRRFFEAVLGRFNRRSEHPELVEGRSELVVVKAGSEVIGGAVLIRFRDTVEVPWISCSRSHFDSCPNNILYWEMMRKACEEGFRTFDFGRSSPDTGPATFKMRWGARAEQLYWHYVLPDGASMPREVGSSNPKFRLASDLWKRAPRALTDYLGPRLIGHLPG